MRALLGAELHVSTEEKPLGTAGAVRSRLEDLDGTTIVLNGDVLTDLDLSAAVAFHREKGAAVTIVLTPVEDARPYGLVPLDAANRVEDFLEKPKELVAGQINAGTYVLEPNVLKEVPPDEFWQFEQQLFPKLLEQGAPVYGFLSDAYWLDIGTPQRYLQATYDILEGNVRTEVHGRLDTANIHVAQSAVKARVKHGDVMPDASGTCPAATPKAKGTDDQDDDDTTSTSTTTTPTTTGTTTAATTTGP